MYLFPWRVPQTHCCSPSFGPIVVVLAGSHTPTPEWLKRVWVRWVVPVAFWLAYVVSQRTAAPLNLLDLAFLLANAVTLVKGDPTWHRYLCPYPAQPWLPAVKDQ